MISPNFTADSNKKRCIHRRANKLFEHSIRLGCNQNTKLQIILKNNCKNDRKYDSSMKQTKILESHIFLGCMCSRKEHLIKLILEAAPSLMSRWSIYRVLAESSCIGARRSLQCVKHLITSRTKAGTSSTMREIFTFPDS